MHSVLQCLVILYFMTTVKTDETVSNTTCIIPNGEKGSCVNSTECPGFLEMWEQDGLSKEEIHFLKLIQCGYEGSSPNVCCPPSGRFKNSTITVSLSTATPRPEYEDISITDRMKGVSKLPSLNECGQQFPLSDRIIGGGLVTSIDEFPWMALLQYTEKEAICGGALISKRYVLTAAHCVTGPLLATLGQLLSVRLGEYDTTSDRDCDEEQCADNPQDIAIDSTFAHPDFNPSLKSYPNDIALVKLKKTAIYNYYVQPICLPTAEHSDIDKKSGSKFFICGWGLTDKNVFSPVKLKLKVPAVLSNKCAIEYNKYNIQLSSRQICAGGEQRKGTCSGDSGGPLMSYDKISDTWSAVGIVSLGSTKPGKAGVPGVYTKVYDYLDWIKSQVR